MLPDKRPRNVYNDVLRCKAPPPNLNPPIFLFRPLGTKLPTLMTANISGYTVCPGGTYQLIHCHMITVIFTDFLLCSITSSVVRLLAFKIGYV